MSKYLVVAFALLVFVSLSCLISAAPFSDVLDAETAIQKIIAAYNRIPGPSVVYPPQVATIIDPNTFVVHRIR